MKKWLVSAGLLVCLLLAFSTPVLADTMLGNDKAQVDVANLASGYVKVAYTGGQDKKVKLRITAPNKVQYDYALNNQGTFEIFPLTEGNGKYTISVYVNVSDAKYSVAFTTDADVKLSSEFAPFLVANQYVNYSHSSAVVAKAAELSKGKTSDLEKVNAIYNYVVTTFTYDTVKAQSVQSGYIPIVDNTLEKKKGICFDYSVVLTSMLRSQNIPCKLVIGYAETVYHAWVNIYTEETGWLENYISFDGKTWKRSDPTYDSTAKGSAKVKEYINNDANYRPKYLY